MCFKVNAFSLLTKIEIIRSRLFSTLTGTTLVAAMIEPEVPTVGSFEKLVQSSFFSAVTEGLAFLINVLEVPMDITSTASIEVLVSSSTITD